MRGVVAGTTFLAVRDAIVWAAAKSAAKIIAIIKMVRRVVAPKTHLFMVSADMIKLSSAIPIRLAALNSHLFSSQYMNNNPFLIDRLKATFICSISLKCFPFEFSLLKPQTSHLVDVQTITWTFLRP